MYECTPWCASAQHRFIPEATALLAYPNKAKNERAAASVACAATSGSAEDAAPAEAASATAACSLSGGSKKRGKAHKWNSGGSKGGSSSSSSSSSSVLSAQDKEAARREAEFQSGCCKGVNYCQQGVGPAVALTGYGNGKGFGVVSLEPLKKGQFVCTYNAEILEEKDAAAREKAWNVGGAALGGRAALPTAFDRSADAKAATVTPERARGRKRCASAALSPSPSVSPVRGGGSGGRVCEADTKAAEERAAAAAAVPGAVMNQITFQIYLDKSGGSKVFDGTIFANVARFMNHSCDPNLKVIKIDCGRPYPLLGFFCYRNVAAGEELTWNYDNSGGGKKSKSGVVCLCGASNCRGFI